MITTKTKVAIGVTTTVIVVGGVAGMMLLKKPKSHDDEDLNEMNNMNLNEIPISGDDDEDENDDEFDINFDEDEEEGNDSDSDDDTSDNDMTEVDLIIEENLFTIWFEEPRFTIQLADRLRLVSWLAESASKSQDIYMYEGPGPKGHEELGQKITEVGELFLPEGSYRGGILLAVTAGLVPLEDGWSIANGADILENYDDTKAAFQQDDDSEVKVFGRRIRKSRFFGRRGRQ